MRVNRSAKLGGIIWIYFRFSLTCVFSLESPHRDDSKVYKQYTIFIIRKKMTPDYPKSAAKGLKSEFETSMVNEPSMLEPLKFYCRCFIKPIKVVVIIDH